jgi:hypothetical protein
VKITDVPFSVLRFQYKLARFPLQFIEERMVVRMGSTSAGRLLYERSFAALDVTMGHALRDSELQRRGAALAERTDALRKAAELDASAEAEAQQAQQEFTSRRDTAVQKQKSAEKAKNKATEQAEEELQERIREAAEAARKRTAQAEQQADKAAARRTDAVERAKRDEQARIKAAEKRATESARSKIEDAKDKRGDAAALRDRADRVEELADVEKEKRRAAKNNGRV